MRKLLDRHIPIIGIIYTVIPIATAAIVTYLLVKRTLGPQAAATAVIIYLMALLALGALVFYLYPKATGLRRGNAWWIGFLRSVSRTTTASTDKENSGASSRSSK